MLIGVGNTADVGLTYSTTEWVISVSGLMSVKTINHSFYSHRLNNVLLSNKEGRTELLLHAYRQH
jgi:hypothetical protein